MSAGRTDTNTSSHASPRLDAGKFVPARLARSYVSRPRLDTLLDEAARARVAIICAPAGAGKSTLLSAWASRQTEKIAWITLDDRDNDPVQLALLLEATAAGARYEYLVLDAAESLTTPDAHEQLLRIVNALPPWIHVLVSSRSRAAPLLRRLRVDQDAVELHARDLRFSADEAAELLADSALDNAEVAKLVEHTDGWATGLVLAMVAGPGDDAEDDARELLRDEILGKQTKDIQRFLMETALLEYVGAAAIERVTGRSDAADVLRRLERENAFLSSVDGDHLRYAYQPQFRDMLRAELRARHPERVGAIHVEGALWCEEHDHLGEAMEHWLSAGREYDALRLLRRAYLRFGDTRPDLLDNWVSRIDTANARGEPDLLLDLASACGAIRDADRFHDVMDRVDVILRRSPDPVSEVHFAGLRAKGAVAMGNIESQVAWLEHAQTIMSAEPPAGDGSWVTLLPRARRLPAWRALGQAWLEHTDEARATLRDRPFASSEDTVDRLFLGCVEATIAWVEGNLDDAFALAQQSNRAAASLGIDHYVMWSARYVTAATRHERDEMTAARVAFEDLTRATAKPSGNTLSIAAEVGLAAVRRAQGQPSEALDRLSRLRRDRAPEARGTTQGWVDRETALTLLQLGQIRAAREVLGPPPYRDREALAVALVELVEGRAEAASRLAASVRRTAPRPMLLATLIDAQAAQLRGDDDAMIAGAAWAMRLAQQHGFLQSVLDFGSGLLPAFRTISNTATDAEFVARVERAHRRAPAMIDLREPGAGTVELTERELEVLRYLPTHLSIREIAQALFVSPNTVKTHAQHLYRKLGVESREAAVARARSLLVLR